MAGHNDQPGENQQVIERELLKPREPDMYKVLLINDDYTTQEFVVEIIVAVFHKDVPTATKIMFDVHRLGIGVVGVYSWDIANTKVEEVHRRARAAEFPLRCRIEKA